MRIRKYSIILQVAFLLSCSRPQCPTQPRCVALMDEGISEDEMLAKKEAKTSDPDDRAAFELARMMVLQRISTQMGMYECIP